MNKVDQDKVKSLIHKIGLKYNLQDDVIKKIVTSPYIFARDKITSLNIEENITEEEFNKLTQPIQENVPVEEKKDIFESKVIPSIEKSENLGKIVDYMKELSVEERKQFRTLREQGKFDINCK